MVRSGAKSTTGVVAPSIFDSSERGGRRKSNDFFKKFLFLYLYLPHKKYNYDVVRRIYYLLYYHIFILLPRTLFWKDVQVNISIITVTVSKIDGKTQLS